MAACPRCAANSQGLESRRLGSQNAFGSFRKLGVHYLGVLIIRMYSFLGSPIFGNSHLRMHFASGFLGFYYLLIGLYVGALMLRRGRWGVV